MSASSDTSTTPLEAALKIVAELKGLTTDQQSLALKFAVETLGLQLPAALSPAPATPPPAHDAPTPRAASGADHSTDIKAFTAMKSPKSDRQFAAVVAYFYQFEAKLEHRKDAIDAETMKDAARLANWPQVARWGMTLTNAKNAGYLDGAGSGKFKLSSVGENLVAITLPGDGATSISKKTASKKPKKAIKKGSKKS